MAGVEPAQARRLFSISLYLHFARGNRLPLPVRVLDTPLACFISIV
jgi:hypothetical protein